MVRHSLSRKRQNIKSLQKTRGYNMNWYWELNKSNEDESKSCQIRTLPLIIVILTRVSGGGRVAPTNCGRLSTWLLLLALILIMMIMAMMIKMILKTKMGEILESGDAWVACCSAALGRSRVSSTFCISLISPPSPSLSSPSSPNSQQFSFRHCRTLYICISFFGRITVFVYSYV